jgi:hypothetical protein
MLYDGQFPDHRYQEVLYELAGHLQEQIDDGTGRNENP